ncbi:MAG: hypothetical protein ACYC4P_11590 [Thermoanaerobaculia bacterium]
MARPCKACGHRERGRLEAAIRSRGERALSAIAEEFALSETGLRRHVAQHSREAQERPAFAQERPEEARAQESGPSASPDAVTRLLTLRTLKLASQADEAGSPRIALAATRVSRELVETSLRAKAAEPPPYDPLRDELLAAMRDRLSKTLEAFPEAREAVRLDFEALVGAGR